MQSLRFYGEILGIFSVSLVALYLFYFLTGRKATGIGWVHWKGLILMGVGVLYIITGFVLTRYHR